MEQIKLFTEEQLIEAMQDARALTSDIDFLLAHYKPIKLPTEKEIKKQSNNWWGAISFEKGAKWVIEQIKQQANGSTE